MCFYNFYSLYFSAGCVSMIASPSEKEVQSFHEVQSLGFWGTVNASNFGPHENVGPLFSERLAIIKTYPTEK
jgi:hypothetical protein